MYTPYEIEIRRLSLLRPSEEIDEPAATKLADAIARAGLWLAPIPVEWRTGIVMDGNHRLHAAGLLMLTHVPCVLLDYDDPRVSVSDWRTGLPYGIGRILDVVGAQRRLPYKTTRHKFQPELPRTAVALSALRRQVGAAERIFLELE